jgi:hypothetical protein
MASTAAAAVAARAAEKYSFLGIFMVLGWWLTIKADGLRSLISI